MRFATLVALAVVVSTTPGLAAPTLYTPNRANFKRDTTTNDIALVQNSTVSANLGTDITKLISDAIPEIEQLLGHAINGTAVNSTTTPKRDASEVVQAIEAALGSLFPAGKRDAAASISSASQPLLEDSTPESGYAKRAPDSDDLQGLLGSLGVSNSQCSVEDRSVGSSTALGDTANAVSIAAGLTKILKAFGGGHGSSGNATRREWNTAIDGIGLERPSAGGSIRFDKHTKSLHSQVRRGFSAPKVTTPEVTPPKVSGAEVTSTGSGTKGSSAPNWLGNLGSIISVGASVDAIANSFTNNTFLKRELAQALDGIDLADLLDGTMAQVQERRGFSAPKVTTPEVTPPKVSSTEVTSNGPGTKGSGASGLLGNIGNVVSIGAGVDAIAGSFTNHTFLKRELAQVLDGIDLADLLDGATAQVQERRGFFSPKVSAPKVPSTEAPSTNPSGISSLLKNIGNVVSIGTGGIAIADAFGSNGTLKRELAEALNGVDLADLLDAVTTQTQEPRGLSVPKFSTPKVSTPEVPSTGVSSLGSPSLSNILGKVAGAVSTGGTVATLGSSLLESNGTNFFKRDSGFEPTHHAVDLTQLLDGATPRINDPATTGVSSFEDEKRSISTGVLEGLLSLFGGALGGSGSGSDILIKRSASDNGIPGLTPEQLQQIVAQLSARGVDLD